MALWHSPNSLPRNQAAWTRAVAGALPDRHALCFGEVGDRRLHSSATEPSSWTESLPLSPLPTDLPSKRYSRYLDSTQGDLVLGETTCTRPLNLLNRSCFSRHIREHVSSLVLAHFLTFRHCLGVAGKLREETEEHWAMDAASWDPGTYRTRDHSSFTRASTHLPFDCPSLQLRETHAGGNCGSGPHQLWDPMQVTALSPRLLPCPVSWWLRVLATIFHMFIRSGTYGPTTCCVPGTLLGAVWLSEGDTQARLRPPENAEVRRRDLSSGHSSWGTSNA